PVILVTYNLPPWLCMKWKFMMLTLLIFGPKRPVNDIDVYLEPLIDDLKSPWDGIRGVYDAHIGEYFILRGVLLWTVNDFPAYGNLSGFVVKGYKPRPICGDDTPSHILKNGHKICYFGHRKWLPINHPYRRHNLDVMHVEKNVFDTLVGTILDIEGKTKDTIKARLDLERMGIRRGLWMNRDSDKARRDLAFFSMKPNDKKEFLKFVSSVKFPDGYASNIARCVNVDGGKFTGLKSHDCHVFMQRLLPVGIRHLLPEDVVKPIMLLSRFFSQLTAKTLRKIDMFQLRHDIVQVLCKFEMIFPPAFFTSMMHVMVHLPEEALLTGPVNYRWMYPIERLLGELKKSVRNRAKPEGSIIEAWVQYESLTFCGMYLKDVETVFNRPQRNNDGGMRNEKLSVFAQSARPFGDPGRGESFSRNDMEVAHWFVLNNCDEIMAYLDEHEEMMKREHPSHLYAKKHRELFPQWFLDSVNKLKSSNSPTYSDELYNLAFGPIRAELLSGCNVNGVKFLGAARDDKLCTQNSGVHVPGGGKSTNIDFYGKLTTVVQLLYKDRYQ
ncbi:PREDICTED: transposase, partial [Prunus dulcis]